MAGHIGLLIVVGIISIILWLLMRKPANYPPGPPRWPIVGNLFQMKVNGQTHPFVSQMNRKYGEVVGIHCGFSPVVLVSGLDAIREVLFRDDMSGRSENVVNRILGGGHQYGIANTEGEEWKIQRRFTLQHLRSLGLGKRTLEGITMEEIHAIFDDIEVISGGPSKNYSNLVSLHEILGASSINVLWQIMSGQRYDHNDPEFQKLINGVKNFLQGLDVGGIFSAFPSLTTYFPILTPIKKMKALRYPLFEFIEEQIKMHKGSIDHHHPRDFIDIYLTKIEQEKEKGGSCFHEKSLRQICAELFTAGVDTTLNTLLFTFLYMILYPNIQQKVQEALDVVTGKDRSPSLEDRPRLPYVEATIQESQRLSTIGPIILPHAPLTREGEISFRGHKIPKGAKILMNLYDLHHDPKLWKEPFEFIPERFLGEHGTIIHHDAFIPFGAGKRSCLGDSLAKNNLFLIFASIMQRYSLSIPDGHEKPSVKPSGNFIFYPKSYYVKVKVRT